MPINIKRVYADYDNSDGIRVLVDRVWPRGKSKEAAKLDYWLKDIAPTSQLRKWFGHDPAKYDEFKQRYREELKNNESQRVALDKLKELTRKHKETITLVYGAKDEKHNQAQVLKEILDHQ